MICVCLFKDILPAYRCLIDIQSYWHEGDFMARHKIGLIGAGNIGGTLALQGMKELGDIVFLILWKGFHKARHLILLRQAP